MTRSAVSDVRPLLRERYRIADLLMFPPGMERLDPHYVGAPPQHVALDETE